jgi:hypothetical protein
MKVAFSGVWTTVLPLGEPEVDRAADRPGADFEASLQYHCATAAGVRFIVTRNRDAFLTDGVRILDPAEFIAIDQSGRRP